MEPVDREAMALHWAWRALRFVKVLKVGRQGDGSSWLARTISGGTELGDRVGQAQWRASLRERIASH